MIILDGGMGQELVKRAGKATDLWSMQALLDMPAVVRQVHDEYFAAGAEIATTNTYAVLPDRLETKGLGRAFAALDPVWPVKWLWQRVMRMDPGKLRALWDRRGFPINRTNPHRLEQAAEVYARYGTRACGLC